jgi:hypothetical protein
METNDPCGTERAAAALVGTIKKTEEAGSATGCADAGGHVALLGDSIFDNGSYTRGQPDVVSHLRAVLPPDWAATLCAVDGATVPRLAGQLRRVPLEATHLAVAIGGNDALQNIDVLDTRVASTRQALAIFGERIAAFEAAYRTALAEVLGLGRSVVVCTIYNGNLEGETARHATLALTLFNDVILRVAFELGIDVVDLRAVCSQPADYANPIEPSGEGGRKIADAVARAAGAVGGDASARVWTDR